MSNLNWERFLLAACLCIISTVEGQIPEQRLTTVTPEETWTGRWLPEHFTAPPTSSPSDNYDLIHGVKMGLMSQQCDDARTNLTLDWDFSPINYTCFAPSNNKILPDWKTKPILECKNIPKFYVAQHKCMNTKINYNEDVPTYGTHRPLWPRYGEYKFVPRQRWIHNLEHGAVVMLYHPCANPMEVNRLKWLVKKCLWRHIITPYTLLDERRPLALLTWGCRLTMSVVQPDLVQNFINQHALNGPEKVPMDGQYSLGLLKPATTVSNLEDELLCPRR